MSAGTAASARPGLTPLPGFVGGCSSLALPGLPQDLALAGARRCYNLTHPSPYWLLRVPAGVMAQSTYALGISLSDPPHLNSSNYP